MFRLLWSLNQKIGSYKTTWIPPGSQIASKNMPVGGMAMDKVFFEHEWMRFFFIIFFFLEFIDYSK